MEQIVLDFFITVNKAECYLHKLKAADVSSYNRLKLEASTLTHSEVDETIFDCMFSEEPKVVRYVMDTIDISKVDSSYENAKRKIEGYRLRFWRDIFRGDIKVDQEKELLYLNYFTLFAGRTGGPPNLKMLENREYLEDSFIKDKLLAKLLTFHSHSVGTNYRMNLIRQGDANRVLLENSNAYLEKQISALYGGN